jgi:hypothetical protein
VLDVLDVSDSSLGDDAQTGSEGGQGLTDLTDLTHLTDRLDTHKRDDDADTNAKLAVSRENESKCHNSSDASEPSGDVTTDARFADAVRYFLELPEPLMGDAELEAEIDRLPEPLRKRYCELRTAALRQYPFGEACRTAFVQLQRELAQSIGASNA